MVEETLNELREEHGSTYTKEVRRAISLYKFMEDKSKDGYRILLNKNGKDQELILNIVE